MNGFILDASVAVKWFLPPAGEPLVREAWRLLALHTEGRVQFAVPDVFWPECANVFWKARRQGRMSAKAADEALLALLGRQLVTTASRRLLQDAFSIAHRFEHAVYDCLYVALAVRSQAPLVTADEGLARIMAAYLPVKWLGLM